MAQLPSQSSASVSKGIWFVFQCNGNIVRAWGSCWTGVERIYFNDELVMESWKRDDHYIFQRQGHEYQIFFCTRSVAQGKIRCRLYQDGTQVGAYHSKRRKVLNMRPTIAHLASGLGIGLLAGLLSMPPWFGLVFIVFSFIITLLTTAKTDNFIIEQAA